MKRRERIINFIIKPPLWVCIIIWTIGVITIGGTITLYYMGLGAKAWALPVHISALLFFILSIYAVLTIIGIPERAKEKPQIKQFFSSYNSRAIVYAACSILFNGCYVVFGIIIANVRHSAWLGVLVSYHIFLILPRAAVFITARIGKGADKRTQREQLRAYEYCGVALIILAIAVIPVIHMTLEDKNSYNYFVSTVAYISAIALYTFVKFGVAVHNLRKSRKQSDLTIVAIKNVSFADALISMFTLQVMMLKELAANDGAQELGESINPAVGVAVIIAILAIGLHMLVKGHKTLKIYKDSTDAVANGNVLSVSVAPDTDTINDGNVTDNAEMSASNDVHSNLTDTSPDER